MNHPDRTPVLVMDLSAVTAAYRALTRALPGIDLYYALKCNGVRPVLATLRETGCGFEIASATELDELLAIGVDPADVLYSNPVKPLRHIAQAYATGVRQFAFDSVDELAKLAVAAPGSLVSLRLAAHGMDSDVPSEGKFGVDPGTAVALLQAARHVGLVPNGIAFHVGSQMMRPHAWRAPLRAVGDIMDKLAAVDIFLELVNVGGGFPARYDTPPPPLAEYGAVIAEGLAALPYPVRVAAEPGRALVAEAGTLVATVIGTATRSGRRWIHLDVGAFNGLMESLETGNRLRFPVRDSRHSPIRELCHLTGPTCDSQDTILFDVPLSVGLSTGDQVYVGCAGAYTTVYASTFNGFAVPEIRCVRDCRRRRVPVCRTSIGAIPGTRDVRSDYRQRDPELLR
jgi:ornithine decarboxylase